MRSTVTEMVAGSESAVAPVTSQPLLVVGRADYSRLPVEVRPGVFEVAVFECCGATWMPGEHDDHRYGPELTEDEKAQLALEDFSSWSWSSPETRVGA